MICTNCSNSQRIKSGIPSCFLPHCNKLSEELQTRLAEKWDGDSKENLIEMTMIRRELAWREHHEL